MAVFLLGTKMICKRMNRGFEKTNSAPLAFVRNVCLCLPVVFVFSFLVFSGFAFAATSCSTPGKDGAGTPSGVINTYYPGTSSVSAGATSIPVGSSSGSATQIAAGDMLLIIQMQDADVAYSNDSNYGGSGAGSGYTALNQTGAYEYAKAAGAVSGGYVSITTGLTNSYRYRVASATNGQSTFQVIRVPQYSSATVSGTVSALNWNGSVGGIVAIDVDSTLTISGTITADGAGFRGGFGRTLTGGAVANTDYRTSYLVAANGSKGEGIAGSPYYMNSPATFNGAPAQASTSGSGYPDGSTTNASYARGAPGNAGGGGTDGNPAANDQNSGGGGGGNYAAGAMGGNSWNSNLTVGGEGGSAVAGLAYNRIVMGGGGGAGTTNNGTADNTTYTNPPGLACSLTTGACSSGAPGGGIILLRANSITGSGTVSANGGSGYNVQNDSGGGGGAGGSVVIYTYDGGSANVTVNGGNGGNAWRSQAEGTFPGNCHGPGGGGSGGFIAYSPSTLGIAMQYAAGISGVTTAANISYGSGSSAGGYSTFTASNPPGPLPGADCVPKLSTSTKTVVDTTSSGAYAAGDVLQYTITLKESSGAAASGVSVTDTIDTNLTGLTVVSYPAGATNSSTTSALNITGISIPANGSVTIVYTAAISASATPGTTINNTATITNPNGIGAIPTAPVVTVSGIITSSGTKQIYLNGTNALSRTMPTASTTTFVDLASGASATWALTTATAKAITLSSSFAVYLQMRRPSTTGNRTLTLTIDYVNGASTVTLGTYNVPAFTMTNAATPVLYGPYAVPLSTSPVTIPVGSTLRLTVKNTSAAGYLVDIYPNYNSAAYANVSQIQCSPVPVIKVDSIGLYNAAYSGGSIVSSVAPGATVYIRTQVSDPFGYADISGATITITDSGGTVRVAATALDPTYLKASSGAIKTYEYAYTVPATGVPVGVWSIKIIAAEGAEGTVTDSAYASMPVAIPPVLTVIKSASPSSVNPGGTVTYTVVVTNTAAGTASNVVLKDLLSPYVQWGLNSYGTGIAFQFTDGTPASGLTLGTPVYSNNSGSTWVYMPTSGGGGAPAGYDDNVTNWQIPMNGTMNANGANFTINYKVRVY
jgi:uncharacterized repeat protein (TIGR01451 family)/fimbrial isopeptide formation D2 family protein